MIRFFATAAKGTEPSLRDELRELRLRGVRADRGGVHFAGEWWDGHRACFESRIASRVLAELATFDAKDGASLYEGVATIDFSPFVSPERTLAVKATTKNTPGLSHSHFVEQKTKDAIVDRMRQKLGARSSIDLDDPDLRVSVRVHDGKATVYVDLSGEALHRRGWRTLVAEASLKETLAATLLRMSGWDRVRPLIDPMCGAGTIAIEGALWSRDVAPGLFRERFGFERWPMHDETLREKMAERRASARARVKSEGPKIIARDLDPAMTEIGRKNARAANAHVLFEYAPVRTLGPTSPPGVIVTNPPWGDRLAADVEAWRDLGAVLDRLRDHGACVLAGTPEILKSIPRKPSRMHVVFNGPIECRALVYEPSSP